MFKNYIKIAWRNLFKHKIDSAISIGGLAVGLACCILLVLYVRFEWSYDSFHDNSERLYRVIQESTQPGSGEALKSVSTPYPMAPELKSTFPEIEAAVRLGELELQVKSGDKYSRENFLLADPEFFEAFTFTLVAGNPETVLSRPDQIVLTESLAERYFGGKNAVGETMTIRFPAGERSFKVSGIAAEPPGNSSIKFGMVLPYKNFLLTRRTEERRSSTAQNWYVWSGQTWLLLNRNSSAEELDKKLPQFMELHYSKSFLDATEQKLGLQPLHDVYFNEQVSPHFTEQGNVLYSWILAGIALVVLIIASCNFMSLTLGRAVRRQHEVGIRKASGAQRSQLVQQFFGEVFITCGFAFILGIILVELFLPAYQQVVQQPVNFDIFTDPVVPLILLVLLVFTTLLTGAYPALVISRKKASDLFQSRRSAERIPPFVKSLIVVQFSLSIAFLIAAFIMQQQLNFLLNKDVGFSPENIIAVETSHLDLERGQKAAVLYKEEVGRLPGVESVSLTSSRIVDRYSWGALDRAGTRMEGLDNNVNIELTDEDFIETMGIQLISGKTFSRDRPSTLSNGIIVNRSFLDALGLKDPIGKEVKEEYQNGFFHEPKRIIGVIQDYHYRPLQYHLEPMVLMHHEAREFGGISSVLVKVNKAGLSQTRQRMTELWEKLFPGETFVYSFMGDKIQAQYGKEEHWSRIIQSSSAIAIFLACFGLFGLAALSAQRRTKEIGIRKVLGATVANIVGLLSKDFLKLVLLGFVIAIPIAWYAMNRWLADFAYRIEVGAGIFLLAGGAAVLIALATVSWQSIRAALANPVESLRSE